MLKALGTEMKSVIGEEKIIERKVEEQPHPLGNGGKITVLPSTEEEIAAVVKYANENGMTITVTGTGTKRGFGGTIEDADILLSLENYHGIVEHTVGDMTITVKSGTKFEELQRYLQKHKQKIPLDPAWPENATIGGVIAVNDSGPKRFRNGSARDVVIGLRTVYPNGSVIRSGGKVVKNVAGYDMNKLFIGSMGTLGVLTEITMKLRPLPEYESLLLLSFPKGGMEEIRSFAVRLLDTMLEPVTLELINPVLAEKLTGQSTYTLAIGFEDVESSVHYQEEYVKKIHPEAQLTILQEDDSREFWQQFYQIGPKGTDSPSKLVTEASMKIGVKNMAIPEVIKESVHLQDMYNLEVFAHGGLGHGLCQVHLKGAAQDIKSALTHLRNLVKDLGGNSVIKYLPLTLRKEMDVWGEKPSYFFLLEGIKKKIDPKKTLNNQRFVGGI
ncbi:glycolate oxidase FAD binding subunit [Evansella vedderi]|uniref:Glycolate oxidase FAD binding subunit n=1 Tax=Evansella vedderi TaxID=38282 RepID=A0ABT9ZWV8_9BACI|nr:FAD-binding oxidoreductase [Evansella vedderi]MDQ0255721.1 glycolate oxidase FAD binding subunit [Evansella vedderi]